MSTSFFDRFNACVCLIFFICRIIPTAPAGYGVKFIGALITAFADPDETVGHGRNRRRIKGPRRTNFSKLRLRQQES